MSIDKVMEIKGVIAAGEFDPSGKLISFKSKAISPDQADSTARLSGSIFTLLDTLSAIYSRYCSIPLYPIKSISIDGLEFSLILKCGKRGCAGAMVKNTECDIHEVHRALSGVVEDLE